MNLGIEFKIPNKYGNHLKQILTNIDREDYMWNITEDEVYIADNIKNSGFLFPQEEKTLSNAEFIDIISQEFHWGMATVRVYLYTITFILAYNQKNKKWHQNIA